MTSYASEQINRNNNFKYWSREQLFYGLLDSQITLRIASEFDTCSKSFLLIEQSLLVTTSCASDISIKTTISNTDHENSYAPKLVTRAATPKKSITDSLVDNNLQY